MAYGEFYVERQGWARWPKTLIMCRKRGHESIERRRYVPERTCEIIGSYLNDFTNIHMCWYEFEMACGGKFTWNEMEPPKFCPNCGARVIGTSQKATGICDSEAVGE